MPNDMDVAYHESSLTGKIARILDTNTGSEEEPRQTPSKPMYKLSQQIFDPSKKDKAPKADEIIITT